MEAEERAIQLRAAEKHAELLQRDLRLQELEHSVSEIWRVLESTQNAIVVNSSSPKSFTTPLPPPPDVVDQLMKSSMCSPQID